MKKINVQTLIFYLFLSSLLVLVTNGFSQTKPGASNTGYSGTLTSASVGTITVDGTVIENVSTGSITVKANNVTIRNCRISGGIYGINCNYGYTGLVIEDCEILNMSSAAVFGGNFTIRRCNIHESNNDGLKPTTNCLVEYNWIHHLGKADGSHADGVQTRHGGTNMTFRYNNFDMPITDPAPYKSNSAFIIEEDGGPITNVLIEYNWMNGGNYTLFEETPGQVNVRYNKFGRDYRYGIMNGVEVHSCNVWEDTGAAIDGCGSTPTVATPVINPSGGTITDPITVSITCATSGADIRYTTDGAEPTESSTLYSGSFVVSATTIVKARGYKTDMNASSVATATFTFITGGGSNVALGKAVTQSAYQNDPPNVNPGSNIVDGNTTDDSRWSASGFPQWAEIDLGSNYDLSSINVFTYQGRAYQYIIESKTDGGSSYTTIVDRSSNTQSSQPIADNVSITARYVKITVSGASGYTGSWVSLTELEVYGEPASGGTISVTGVSVSPTSLDLTEGETADLTETVAPANATDQSVTWSSNNTSIATVNSSGLVTAISAGNATITVTTVDGGFTANCTVTVNPAIISVTGVSVSPTSLDLTEGETADLTETVAPANATDQSVTWSSDNTSIATVNSSGLVTAVSAGNATITVTTTDGGYTANCAVTVNASSSSYNLALGKPVTVSAYQDDEFGYKPGENLVDDDISDDARWSADGFPQWAEIDLGQNSDLSSIELYTYQGRAYQYIVEAKADGGSYSTIVDRSSNTSGTQPITDAVSATARYVKITVNGASGYAGSWISLNELKVIGSAGSSTIPVTGVSVSPTLLNLEEGQTSDLTETVNPVDATDKSVNWSSSNSSIATVDANGLVTAVAAGNATITVTTVDGGFTANCSVSVTPAIIYVTGVSVSPTTLDLVESETAQLTETVSPANATDNSVSWSSSNSSIATVDANGLVTAVAAGNATITVTTTDGSFTANCAVTVSAPAETWVQLTYDDFESGWGNFKDGGGDCYLYTGGTYAHQGSNAGQIQDNQDVYSTFYYTNSVDVQAYSQIKIEFWFYGLGMDDGHDFFVEYSDDGGSTWQSIAQYIQGSGADFVNGQFYSVTDGGDFESVIIDDGSYSFTSNAKIRFRCDGLQNDDQVYIDEVKVTALDSGTSGANISLADNTSSTSVNIYPNPLNSGTLNIAVNGYNEAVNVTIYDLTGRSVYAQQYFNQTEIQIPANELNSGIYIISVNGNQQKLVVK